MKNIKRISIICIAVVLSAIALESIALAADNFSSGGTVTPEKDVYYVGDKVDISDLFKNKSGSTATSVSVEYYYRLNGANSVYSGSPINFGTISAGASKSHAFSYTFKEDDIGDYRIGAKITYTMGGASYSEYSSGHDFEVMQAPTSTPSPTTTITPTPEPTLTPTPTAASATDTPAPTPVPTETPEPTEEPLATFTPQPEPDDETGELKTKDYSGIKALLKDRGFVMMLIIIVAIILVLLMVLIVVMVAKKK